MQYVFFRNSYIRYILLVINDVIQFYLGLFYRQPIQILSIVMIEPMA